MTVKFNAAGVEENWMHVLLSLQKKLEIRFKYNDGLITDIHSDEDVTINEHSHLGFKSRLTTEPEMILLNTFLFW